tara:strand:- start:368 stop:514 length:147 start_codon:yes stop_codon:yes gene_type:complete
MNKEEKQEVKKRIQEELKNTLLSIIDYKESIKLISMKIPSVVFLEWMG